MKLESIHNINGTDIAVTAEQRNQFPPSFVLTAKHPKGVTHSQSLTIGDVELKNIASLEDAQKFLDAARLEAATVCNKKAALSEMAAQLK